MHSGARRCAGGLNGCPPDIPERTPPDAPVAVEGDGLLLEQVRKGTLVLPSGPIHPLQQERCSEVARGPTERLVSCSRAPLGQACPARIPGPLELQRTPGSRAAG